MRALITGGTGSFGRAYAKHLLETTDHTVVVFSRDEQKHYAMDNAFKNPRMRFFVGDVRDYQRLLEAMRGVDYVIHAAAMKHVPVCEYNPQEAIATNILGAQNVARAAIENMVEYVVALSTDKAVAPINLYGATKLAAEKIFLAYNHLSGGRTAFSCVRYGNVMGSAGSVLPFWEGQRSHGAITLTDPNMTRFFLLMSDAIALVDHALKTMEGGEIYIPDLPAVLMADVAKALAPECTVSVSGIRPGEKLHERLLAECEAHHTVHDGYAYRVMPEIDFLPERSSPGDPVDLLINYHSGNMTYRLALEQVQELVSAWLEERSTGSY
jgi:UDP-N-acetylglucosamine 4,6-dehydratase